MNGKTPAKQAAVAVFLVAAAGIAWHFLKSPTVPAEPLKQEVYVWQRQWTAAVGEALADLPKPIGGVFPLAAEVRFEAAGPDRWDAVVTRSAIDFGALAGRTGGLVIRIGDSGARTGWNASACGKIAELVRECLDQAATEASGFTVRELQIDYDCPQSKLADYARLLTAAGDEIGSGPDRTALSFTALPSWLGEPDFPDLAGLAEDYVLQVHALELPPSPEAPVRLIDIDNAEAAVRRASGLKQPFRVALPTYSSFVVFDGSGRVVDVISEDLPEDWPSGHRFLLGRSPPAEIAALVRRWNDERPPELQGIIWYRLPVSRDRMNWPALTWRRVLAGETPVSQLEVRLEKVPEGFSRIVIENLGEQPEPLPSELRIESDAAPVVAADGSALYRIGANGDEPIGATSFHLTRPPNRDLLPLPPGKTVHAGWIRFRDPDAAATIRVK